MTRRFDGKVSLITGASRGIGKATAIAFGQEGAKVIVNYHTTEPDEVVRELERCGAEFITVRADVRKREEVRAMVKQAIEEFGKIDILVNNAGILRWKPFLDTDISLWNEHWETNVVSAFHVTQEVLPFMVKQRYGKIVFLSSIVGKQGSKTACAYATSKAALLGFMRSIAWEFAPYGIIVNAVAPSYIDTDLVHEALQKNREKILADHPVGRVGTPEEVARTILFLASDEAPFIAGETININGARLRD